jgi:hypothetical protein
MGDVPFSIPRRQQLGKSYFGSVTTRWRCLTGSRVNASVAYGSYSDVGIEVRVLRGGESWGWFEPAAANSEASHGGGQFAIRLETRLLHLDSMGAQA